MRAWPAPIIARRAEGGFSRRPCAVTGPATSALGGPTAERRKARPVRSTVSGGNQIFSGLGRLLEESSPRPLRTLTTRVGDAHATKLLTRQARLIIAAALFIQLLFGLHTLLHVAEQARVVFLLIFEPIGRVARVVGRQRLREHYSGWCLS
jgi:hypothetical protein